MPEKNSQMRMPPRTRSTTARNARTNNRSEHSTNPAEFFGIVQSCAMRDPRLSLELKGMLAIVATFPPNWDWHRSELQRMCNLKRKKYFRLIREAKEWGFLETVKERYHWKLRREPVPQKDTSSPLDVEPVPKKDTELVPKKDTGPVPKRDTLSNRSFSKSRSSSEPEDQNLSPDGVKREACDCEQMQGGEIVTAASEETIAEQNPEPTTTPTIETKETATLPGLVLTSETTTGTRSQRAKKLIEAMYRSRWGRPCPWGAAEGAQLKRFLDENPEWDDATFTCALTNYANSHRPTPGERPCKFLPHLHDYCVEPIDRFGKSFHAPIITARIQNQIQSAHAIAEGRRQFEQEQRQLPESTERRKADGYCEIHHCSLVFDEEGNRVCDEAGDRCVFAQRHLRRARA